MPIFMDRHNGEGITPAHDDMAREAIEEHNGHVVKHTGDGIMISFPAAVNTLHTAAAFQQSLAQRRATLRNRLVAEVT